LSYLICSICVSSCYFRSSACASLNSIFPTLSASLIFLLRTVISLLRFFYCYLVNVAVISWCSRSYNFYKTFYLLPLVAPPNSFKVWLTFLAYYIKSWSLSLFSFLYFFTMANLYHNYFASSISFPNWPCLPSSPFLAILEALKF